MNVTKGIIRFYLLHFLKIHFNFVWDDEIIVMFVLSKAGHLHAPLQGGHLVQLVLGVGQQLVLTANIVETRGLEKPHGVTRASSQLLVPGVPVRDVIFRLDQRGWEGFSLRFQNFLLLLLLTLLSLVRLAGVVARHRGRGVGPGEQPTVLAVGHDLVHKVVLPPGPDVLALFVPVQAPADVLLHLLLFEAERGRGGLAGAVPGPLLLAALADPLILLSPHSSLHPGQSLHQQTILLLQLLQLFVFGQNRLSLQS